mgnify:CR=1 FL=1|tara:strand:+ start:175 stop:1575 length:1401 start_codon:yes stop_codon:yes gene_type:complete
MALLSFTVKNYIHKTQPIHQISDAGEIRIEFDKEKDLGRMVFLYDEDANALSIVNNWLIYLKAYRGLSYSSIRTHAQALLSYFTFLDVRDMAWDHMPTFEVDRPTYAYKYHLEKMAKDGLENCLANSTAKSYMQCVVKFYKHYLAMGIAFEEAPFQYQKVKISPKARYSSIQAEDAIIVDTTDLRLKLPRDQRNGGEPRELIPLNDDEWLEVNKVLIAGRGIKHKEIEENNDKSTLTELEVALPVEFRIACYLARFTGLRRQELVTFRLASVKKPLPADEEDVYMMVDIGQYIGVETKNKTLRTIEIPTELMKLLFKYTHSEHFLNRLQKYRQKHPDKLYSPPLLINQRGDAYDGNTINGRWGEVRNLVKKTQKDFEHKFHNLRSTYAAKRLRQLLKFLSEEDAIDKLGNHMGHKDPLTTRRYLKYAKTQIKGNNVHEQALVHLLGESHEEMVNEIALLNKHLKGL